MAGRDNVTSPGRPITARYQSPLTILLTWVYCASIASWSWASQTQVRVDLLGGAPIKQRDSLLRTACLGVRAPRG